MKAQFLQFVEDYGKEYEAADIFDRFATFKQNMATIENHDEGLGWKMKVNEFADLSWVEFKDMYKGYNHRSNAYARSRNLYKASTAPSEVPASVDWVVMGAVTPVKNQGQCGSCWSFSTTGATEGALQIATGKLVSLSEQQLVDCAGSFGNEGCNGGLMDDGFEYIIKNGITTEDNYPYKAEDGDCQSFESVAKLTGYQDVAEGDEDALKSAVSKQPVSIAIEADQSGFQFYSSGVFSGECGTNLDHGVLLVGYGTENGEDFWKVKNSWGSSWGEDGYIKLKRNMDECGVANSASYPTGASLA